MKLYLSLIFAFFSSSTMETSFKSYVKFFNDSVTFFRFQPPPACFGLASFGNDSSRTAIHFFEEGNLTIALSQNLFSSSPTNTLESFDFLAFDKEKSILVVIMHDNEVRIDCRPRVFLHEIIGSARKCLLFDRNHKLIADVSFYFFEKPGFVRYSVVKNIDGKKYASSIPFDFSGVPSVCDYQSFCFFVKEIVKVSNLQPKDKSWVEYGTDYHITRIIESGGRQ